MEDINTEMCRGERVTLNSDVFDGQVVDADTFTYSLTDLLQTPLSTKCNPPQILVSIVCNPLKRMYILMIVG